MENTELLQSGFVGLTKNLQVVIVVGSNTERHYIPSHRLLLSAESAK